MVQSWLPVFRWRCCLSTRLALPTVTACLLTMQLWMQQVTTVLEESQAQFNQENATAWDHTLTFGYGDVYYGYLYAVPAGMGIEFDWNTYIADPEETIYSRYAMVNHGTDAEARLVADGWQPLISTEDLIVYERPDTQ